MKVFISFLRDICGVSENKVKLCLLLYPDLDDGTCKAYWIDQTGVKPENFTRSVRILGRHKTRRLQYGVCIANTSSTYLKVKVNVWLELLAKELINNYAGIV